MVARHIECAGCSQAARRAIVLCQVFLYAIVAAGPALPEHLEGALVVDSRSLPVTKPRDI